MTWKRFSLIAAMLLAPSVVGLAKEPPQHADKKVTSASKLNTLEKLFAKKMSGSVMVGFFTVDGQKNDKPASPERYEIESVKKLKGDDWVFLARIKYGQLDVKVPVPVKLVWAQDTPVLSLTDLAIPLVGRGTFSTRILFHGDRYAGTWQHGKVGGHMFGHIEKAAKQAEETGAVRGQVLFDGEPLAKGSITFVPDDGKGKSVSVKILDGRFKLDISTGRKRVKIRFNIPSLDAKYDSSKSPLRVDVQRGENELRFELTK